MGDGHNALGHYQVAKAVLAMLEADNAEPEKIAFWKEAVADCEAELSEKGAKPE